MTAVGEQGRSDEWVGWYRLDGPARPIRLSVGEGTTASATLDLFDDLAFRLPCTDVRTQAARLSFTAPAQRGPLAFNGAVTDGQVAGVVRGPDLAGSFRLKRVIALPLSYARAAVGAYRLHAGETMLVCLGGDTPHKSLFYARGDRLVPLYPLSEDTAFSELGEMITFARGPSDRVTGLHVCPLDGADTVAPAIEPYGDEEVRFAGDGVSLAGTLLTPPGAGPHPAVVLMHGSMPNERDFYRVYADRFARRGIAALIYDKRGSGASTGDPRSTIAQRADDALAAVHSLWARPEIDRRRVGLWGFSNATWSLPLAAARSDAVAFLIAAGAAGVTMARAETHRRVAELRQWGLAEATLRDVASAWSIAFAYAASGHWQDAWDEQWPALVQRLRADAALPAVPLQQYARANPHLSPIPPLLPAAKLRATYGGALPDFARDPVADYERVTCPVLFLVGEEDRNLPARESAARVAAALERAGNRDFIVRVLPGVEHTLNLSYPHLRGITAEAASMALHAFRFAPGVLDLMSDWLAERAGISS